MYIENEGSGQFLVCSIKFCMFCVIAYLPLGLRHKKTIKTIQFEG